MRTRRALQQVLLDPAAALLRQVTKDTDGDPQAGRDVLDAAASQIAGFDLDGYRQMLGIEARLGTGPARCWAGQLLGLVATSGVPQRLALATLAQPAVTDICRRTTGAYYTDFRLARYLASRTAQLAATPLSPATSIIDTAAGTGVLLVALAEQICGTDPAALRDLVAHSLSAVDLDPACHRATVTALASLSADLDAISSMARRIRTADSLVADNDLWRRLSPSGRFDVVIGNPPWDRLRVTRHETLLASGAPRHYGADYDPTQSGPLLENSDRDLDRVRRYIENLARRYALLGDREIDLFHAFLAHGWSLVNPGGSLGMLLPAGLIRAQGTTLLREHLLTTAREVDLTVFHNRSRFFGIDTRFKFLAVCAQLAGRTHPGRTHPGGATLRLRCRTSQEYRAGGEREVREPAAVRIAFDALLAARRDLTVPEVTSEREWRLFQHMAARGSAPHDPDSPWAMRITREVDMTRARRLFSRRRSATNVPVVEGRMVHQYRSGAKRYVSGTGRTAIWAPLALGEADWALAQFFVEPALLPGPAQERISLPRVGFCDIVGQTNERTLQAALIGPGQICGNKVPTIDFSASDGCERRQREMGFLAAANSLIVDWFVRRVVTTSLNFFVLLGVPLPAVDPGSPAGRRLVQLAERITAAERSRECSLRQVAEDRAEIDMLVCDAYGIDPADLSVLLADFPLLDRGQPPLPGETKSTVTADLLAGLGGNAAARERYHSAVGGGACAYVPEEFAQVEARRSALRGYPPSSYPPGGRPPRGQPASGSCRAEPPGPAPS